ncbi:response regulator transcription factor [Aerococcus urinaeequi]|uniref:response regulator transcription factor n=1 Tax=Aerococcus urinaeequi TaxID=51665 RepID=UPI003AAA3770
MIQIMIVEDDKILSDNIKEICSDLAQVAITQVYNGDDALYEASGETYDLIILDLMLPGMNGYQILSKLRADHIKSPVLILTAKDGLEDKVEGFQSGADDYLTKPFYREELLLRIRALLRRSLGLFDENQLVYKNLTINLEKNAVRVGQETLPILGKELDLLIYLIQNKGIILTKEQIFDRIWGFNSETAITVVEVYMSNLRKHLKAHQLDKSITTIRNVGYMLTETEEE